ncbi:MAG TPA: hypothetical protein VLT57_16255 [Bryobacteraceae bacterium]|nr:hypothetical protein [Bryobacteraceae bacterium]
MTLCQRYWRGMALGGIVPDFRSMRQRGADDNAIAWVARTPEQKQLWEEAVAASWRIKAERPTQTEKDNG